MSPERPPLLVFSDDWGRHPSSCQHLVTQLLPEHRVTWVNTIGTRRPRLSLADARRGFAKLRQWITPAPDHAGEAVNPRVINPPMWPDFASPLSRRVNATLISRAVNRALAQEGDAPPVVLTTVPLVVDALRKIPAARIVYYCVDDWSTWPGLDHATLDGMESELLKQAHAVAAVSQPLAERMRQRGHEPLLLTHGVDLPMWREPLAPVDHPTLRALRQIRGPRLVFWGLIDSKIDRDALTDLAARNVGTIVLIGPLGQQSETITSIPGVTHLDAVSHALLPAAAEAADVLLMPYRAEHPALVAAQPLKLMEYLATDKAVVCTDMAAAQSWSDACDVVSSGAFADRVMQRVTQHASAAQLAARRRRLPQESWRHKAQLLESLLYPTAGKRAAA